MYRRHLVAATLLLAAVATGWWLGRTSLPAARPAPAPKAALGQVYLTPAQLRQAGIQVEPVQRRDLQETVACAGTLALDPDRVSQVSSPVAGRATTLRAGVGDRVAAGQQLAVIHSSELTRVRADYSHAVNRYRLAQATLEQRRRLLYLGDEARRPVEEARLEAASANSELAAARSQQGQAERALRRAELLYGADVISMRQLEETRTALEQTQARTSKAADQAQVASGHRQREEQVHRQALLSAPKIAEAEADLQLAREEVEHSAAILEGFGVTPDGPSEALVLRAPRAGVVQARAVTLGEAVDALKPLFTIVDSSQLWLWVELYEQQLARVKPGDRALLSVPAYPGHTFTGRVSYLEPELDPRSRTLRARVLVASEGKLKAGMYASVELVTGSPRSVLGVPNAALQTLDEPGGRKSVVYRETAPGQFKRLTVSLGAEQGDWTEVREGLQPGDRVAVSGVFLLKSMDLRVEAVGP